MEATGRGCGAKSQKWEKRDNKLIVGLDMGGTHIDAVVIANGRIIKTVKKPTDRKNLFESIWATLAELFSEIDKTKIKCIKLSTTVSTNAIVESKTEPVGMIIQSGPGLVPDFLACGEENVFISGYVDHRGKVVKDIDLQEIEQAARLFKQQGIEACAVVTKFSPRNPTQELRIRELMHNRFQPISLGHSMSGKLNFPRRVFTSYLNSAVYSTFQDFVRNLRKSLVKEEITAPLFVLKADGGTMNMTTALARPVETILSGPAASLQGINALLGTDKDALLLDIGGTTTDIFFLADGVPLLEPLGIKLGAYKTLVRAIYSVSIGLGGDSSIKIENGKIKIGPQKEGEPCALGGPKPTPTDAMIALGLMQIGDRAKALEAMQAMGSHLGLAAERMAEEVLAAMAEMLKNKVGELLQEINAKPVYTIKELLYGKKIEPQLINVIGGPAQVMAPILAEKFQLPCYYPENYQVANAIGAALAKTTTEITMVADTSRGILSVPELEIYEKIDKTLTPAKAKARALALLEKRAISLGAQKEDIEPEIIEESSFNVVRGFSTSGQNIRIKAQVKPGLSSKLRGEENH
jgi:N-methylhydantoinase A/oxoprolinase/acetone carboxylase beta subunit